jgi:hypothetical protein
VRGAPRTNARMALEGRGGYVLLSTQRGTAVLRELVTDHLTPGLTWRPKSIQPLNSRIYSDRNEHQVGI